MNSKKKYPFDVMRKYSPSFKFSISLHIFIVLPILLQEIYISSFYWTIIANAKHLEKFHFHGTAKKITISKTIMTNIKFTRVVCLLGALAIALLWLWTLLLTSGDVHPNPGPSSMSSNSSSSNFSNSLNDSFSFLNTLNLSKHLSFIHYNVQSIANKLDILTAELSDFDILAFSETWLHAAIQTTDLLMPNFKPPERKDRARDHHGGVMIYVKDSVHYTRRNDLEPLNIECIWIEIQLKQTRILFGLFYRPPNSDALYLSAIEDSISLALDTQISNIIVTGDFNLNVLNPHTSNKISDICTQFSLYQTITEPTHFTEHSSSLIDLVFTSDNSNILYSGVAEPFLHQDIRYHCPIYGICKFSKNVRKSFTRCIWKYDEGNYDLLRTKLSETNWDAISDTDVNIFAKNLTNYMITLSTECIPNKTIRIRPSDPPWITTAIRRQIRKRKRAYRKAKSSNTPHAWNKFKKIRNKVIECLRKSKQQYFNQLSDKLKSENLSSKDWWPILKSFISPSSNSSIPTLEKDGLIFTDETDKANVLNDFFRDQTILDDQHAPIPNIEPYTDNTLSSLVITPLEVESIMKCLPLGKAVGPDGINNRILRECSRELSHPLCFLLNHSLSLGIFPATWKDAMVCAIYKKGDMSSVSNYRPISLLSCLEKVAERAVFKHLYNHLHENSILTPLQSGFIPGDSPTNQLTYLYDTFSHALDSGKEIRVVFCDISKAFDRVWHQGILLKLQAAGVTGNLLSWFRSYLSNRRQKVVLPGASSTWNFIFAGVPQGSILGPLLFLLYINDIVKNMGSNIRLFADDTSIFIIVENPISAAQLLNSDLEKIAKWALDWLVTFNPIKTEALLISRKLQPLTIHHCLC